MSSSDPAPAWNWPKQGDSDPPLKVEGGFGPVSMNDSIVLTFSPSSYTGNINLYCSWQNGQQGQVWTIYNNKGSPFTYTFNETTPNQNDLNDEHICHFFFPGDSSPGGSGGNTQTFQYLNAQSKGDSLWTQDGVSAKPQSTSSAAASATSSSISSSSVASLPLSTITASNQPVISTGGAVGITIGAIAVLVALGVLAFFLLRRRRQRRQEPEVGPMSIANEKAEYYSAPPAAEPPMMKLGELDGQWRAEMDAARGSTLPAAERSELPAD